MGFWKRLDWRNSSSTVPTADAAGPRKWLPAIDRDYCGGCSRCVDVCPADSLGLVWDFATLLRPESCTSEGACVAACPERLIQMTWLPLEADHATGRWETTGRTEAG